VHVSDAGKHEYVTDSIPPGEAKRDDAGPLPIELLLGALGGCVGVDIVSILGKMRLDIRGLRIETTGERADDHPRVFQRIHMIFDIDTEPSDPAKILRALELSTSRYCSVFAMLARSAKLSYALRHEGREYPGLSSDGQPEPGDVRE
jgi:putative redox protein